MRLSQVYTSKARLEGEISLSDINMHKSFYKTSRPTKIIVSYSRDAWLLEPFDLLLHVSAKI